VLLQKKVSVVKTVKKVSVVCLSNDDQSRHSPNSLSSVRSLDAGMESTGSGLGVGGHGESSVSAGASPLTIRREKEAFQSRTSSGGSLSGKVPPQRPPPPSPAALSRVGTSQLSSYLHTYLLA